MKPVYLKLTGFKGIKSGLGKDEIELELNHSGLIVLKGPNGTGKSTILQNMHPYLLMPDRVKTYSQQSFSYYNECFLPESRKELIWQMNGATYKTVVEINPQKRKTKAFLYIIDGSKETLIEETKDGTVDSYINTIEKILGPANLFFTSVFRCQNSKSLSTYSKGELEDIFKELLNIQLYENCAEYSKTKVKDLTSSIQAYHEVLSKNEPQIIREPEVLRQIDELKNKKEQVEKENTQLQQILSVKQSEITKLQDALLKNKTLIEKQKELNDRIQALKLEIDRLNKLREEKRNYYNSRYKSLCINKEKIQEKIKKKPEIQQKINELNKLLKDKEPLQNQLKQIDEKINTLNSQIQKYQILQKRITELQNKKHLLEKRRLQQLSQTETSLKVALQKAELLEKVPCKDTEFATECLLLKDAILAKAGAEELLKIFQQLKNPSSDEITLQNEIQKITEEIKNTEQFTKEIEPLSKQRQELFNQIKSFEHIEKELFNCTVLLNEIEQTEKNISLFDEQLQAILKEGKTILNEIDTNIKNLTAEVEKLEKELKSIVIDIKAETQYQQLMAEIEQITRKIQENEKIKLQIEFELGKLTQEIENIKQLKTQQNEIKQKIAFLDKEVKEWSQVQKIYSELIPLEIEDAGPEISEIANQLLNTCYGARFSITLITQTQAITKAFKDTFEILVYDAQAGSKKPLYWLSGGEKIWIEEAITRAICLYNKQRSGKQYLTLFADEKDGALDVENRRKYWEMKKKVLELGGFVAEYFVSHDPEVWDMADVVIDIEKLKN